MTFPLTAIVGQESLVEALLVNAVAPDVGGVLVRGERGTAKSTAVRALAPLLPPVGAAAGQAFAFAPGERAPDGRVPADAPVAERPAPLVELPLGATLDRLVGALDLARALAGDHAFEPGLLARAHRGILYVDEVNLLPDHLVDALLDAAATGVARVERDAVSIEHDARFMLVGTMNVEEGELRPQLLDRFGLGVEVRGSSDPAVRAEIVRRRLTFEADPEGFAARFGESERTLTGRIARARERVVGVQLPERELLRITGACARLGVDGVRGDIVCARAARALAALDGDDEVGEEHVRRAAALALAHRRRHDPLEPRAAADDLERALDGEPPDGPDGEPPAGPPSPNGRHRRGERNGADHLQGGDDRDAGTAESRPEGMGERRPRGVGDRDRSDRGRAGEPDGSDPEGRVGGAVAARERRDPPVPAGLHAGALRVEGAGSGPRGRRARATGPGAGTIDSRPAAAGATDLATVATLRAGLARRATSARHGSAGSDLPAAGAERSLCTHRAEGPHLPEPGVEPWDLREHVRAGREGLLLCLVVDASGSMGARRRLARVKGALLAVLRDAYARRDRVAVIAFRAGGAHRLVTPGTPLERAADAIRRLPAGGRTPLAAGLDAAERTLRRERVRDPGRRAIAIVFTDGRVADPNGDALAAAARLGRAAAAVHVVDTEDGPVRLGLAAALARAAGGRLHALVPLRSAA